MAQFAIDEVLTTGIQISGFILYYSSSLGTPGQILASTSSGVMWQADSSIVDLSSLSGQIAATGTTLNNKINSLSGYVNNTFLSGSGTQYYVPRWNTSKELVTGSIYDNGNVGIGTNNPSSKLTIYDHTNGATLNLVGRGSDDTAVINFRSSGDLSTYAYLAPDTNEFRTYHNDGFMSFYPGGSEKLRITAAGNVGIGVTNPGARLQVVNTGSITSISTVRIVGATGNGGGGCRGTPGKSGRSREFSNKFIKKSSVRVKSLSRPGTVARSTQ